MAHLEHILVHSDGVCERLAGEPVEESEVVGLLLEESCGQKARRDTMHGDEGRAAGANSFPAWQAFLHIHGAAFFGHLKRRLRIDVSNLRACEVLSRAF